MEFALATQADNAELRRILRENALEGDIRLTFEREPDFFLASSIEGDVHETLVAREKPGERRIIALGSRSVREAWINGERCPLGYLSQLRVDAPFRAHPGLLSRGYRFLRELHQARADAPYYLTTIIEDNHRARDVLESGRMGLPTYQARDALCTLVIPTRAPQARTDGTNVRPAGPRDLEGILRCLERYGRRHQFHPVWTREGLTDSARCRGLGLKDFSVVTSPSGEVSGCVALWDQRAFKQSVVRGYSGRLAWARSAINWLGPLLRLGLPPLPRPGEGLAHATLSHLAVDDDQPEAAQALVDAGIRMAARSGLTAVTLGLAERNPLLSPIRRRFKGLEYRSILYQVYWEDGSHDALRADGRVPHVEIAVL
jgi:hypothetical protein